MIAACGNSNPHGGHFDYARRRPCVGNIGRPIVAMTELPHYPSSAELAAFRRSIAPDKRGPTPYASWDPPFASFAVEREHGIGSPYAEHRGQSDVDGRSSSYARRMASAQRTAEANVPNECCSGYVWSHAAYCENR